jgi:hypothetical protein
VCQSEEEAGSAGEQPVSNKIDVYTEKEGWTFLMLNPYFFW